MDRRKIKPNKILLIDTWSSTCGNCGKGADPNEKKHKTVLGYKVDDAGCGVKWEYVSSNYTDFKGTEVKDWCTRLRPDLKYIRAEEAISMINDIKVPNYID